MLENVAFMLNNLDVQVVPCCYDMNAKYQFGNPSKQSFDEIWHSEEYMDFRNSMLMTRKQNGHLHQLYRGEKSVGIVVF